MSTFRPMTHELYAYTLKQFVKESSALSALRQAAYEHEYAHKMTPPEQTHFLCFLLGLIKAKRVIEVGAFVGYTTLAMAEALPEDGQVIACEKNQSWLELGQPFWRQSNSFDKISVCLDDARVSLQAMLDEGHAGRYDFIYIDADKCHYELYLELCLQLIHSRGLLVFDNVLRVIHGDVVQPETPTTRALARFNQLLCQRDDVEVTVLPMSDGLALVTPRVK